MKLSFKFKPSISKKQLEIVEELSYHTTKLYNIINYDLRENGVKTYYDIEKEYKSNWHCDFLHSHTRQQMFKVLEQNWKSYFASVKDFGINPTKYKAKPRPPKFKNTDKPLALVKLIAILSFFLLSSPSFFALSNILRA